MKDTIDMAREAGYHTGVAKHDLELLKAFEALVRADERERLQPKKIKATADDYCQGDERYYANE